MIGICLFDELRKYNKIHGKGLIVVKATIKIQWPKEIERFSNYSASIVESYAACNPTRNAKVKQLKKQQKKFDEAQKLANMSSEEKLNYEYNQKLQELNDREAELSKRELLAETEKQLNEKGLPTAVAALIIGKDAETTLTNITSFADIFNKAVESEVAKRIGTGAPKANQNASGISKEQFKNMSLAQQAELFRTQPDLYKQLTN